MKEEILQIQAAKVSVNHEGKITGQDAHHSVKYLGQLKNVFEDQEAYEKMAEDTIAYEVDYHAAVEEGKEGGLFFGTSCIHPGQVGNEYFMTKGHYHKKLDTAEYYWGISGTGVLLLMDEQGNCTAEKVEQGSLHYIPGKIAHRLVNTGDVILKVGACWPSDAGHDYGTIEENGFTAKVINVEGAPVVISK